MYVTVQGAPAEFVSLEEAKRHLHVEGGDEDAYIGGLIAAAVAHIEGPDGWLGRSLGRQTLLLTMDGCGLFPGTAIDLPYPPYADMVSISYDDADGIERSFPIEDVVVTQAGKKARLLPKYGAAWPRPRRSPDAVRITWQAGYEAGDPAAKPLKQAVLLLVGHWFQNREAVIVGQTAIEIPFAVSALLSPYRIWGA